MIYAFLAAIVIGFGAGFYTSHEIDSAEIIALESAIKSANDQAKIIMTTAKKESERIKSDQRQLAQQLEKSHEQNIQTVNALRDQLATVRLPAAHNPRSGNAKNNDHGTQKPEAQADNEQLPATLDRLVKAEFYRADTVAEYAEACYTFVVEQNCGVPVQDPVDKQEPEISGESITDDSWFD